MAPCLAWTLPWIPPLSTRVGAGVKPSALDGRASRQVGGGGILLLRCCRHTAYGAPARWECADIRDMRGEYDRQPPRVTSLRNPLPLSLPQPVSHALTPSTPQREKSPRPSRFGPGSRGGKVWAAQNRDPTFPTEVKLQNPTPPPIRASPALPALPPHTLHTAALPHWLHTASSSQAAVSDPTIGLPAGLPPILPRHWPARQGRTPTLRLKICRALTHPPSATSLETWMGEPGGPHVGCGTNSSSSSWSWSSWRNQVQPVSGHFKTSFAVEFWWWEMKLL